MRIPVALVGCVVLGSLLVCCWLGTGWREEDRVVVYSVLEVETLQKLKDAFERKYPSLKMEFYRAPGSKIRERVLAEERAERQVADVVDPGNWEMEVFRSRQLLAAYRSPEADFIDSPYRTNDDMTVPYWVVGYGILYNTRHVQEAEAPRSWMDLLSPQWKGRLRMVDPRPGGGGLNVLVVLRRELGEQYLRRLAEQEITFSAGSYMVMKSLAAGEFAIQVGAFDYFARRLQRDGGPVQFVVPRDGLVFNTMPIAVLKKAPHPEAARRYIDFVLSREGQAILRDSGVTPVRSDMGGDSATSVGPSDIRRFPPPTAEELRNLSIYSQMMTDLFFSEAAILLR